VGEGSIFQGGADIKWYDRIQPKDFCQRIRIGGFTLINAVLHILHTLEILIRRPPPHPQSPEYLLPQLRINTRMIRQLVKHPRKCTRRRIPSRQQSRHQLIPQDLAIRCKLRQRICEIDFLARCFLCGGDVFAALKDGAFDEGFDEIVEDGDCVGKSFGVVDAPKGTDSGAEGLYFLDCRKGFRKGRLPSETGAIVGEGPSGLGAIQQTRQRDNPSRHQG
jgi:hypothetical protein